MMVHVDDFIDEFSADKETAYPRFFFHLHRLPAHLQATFRPFTEQFKLFCDYEGKRYRVLGASRLGDIWLTTDFKREAGYELRVDLSKCSKWGREP